MNRIRQRPLAVGPLRAFEAVARRLNFRAAAEELHLSQPAVSRQIRALEEELGTPLFVRGTRHVEITAAGAALLRAAAPMLDRLDVAVRQIRIGQSRRPIGMTTFASFASMWLLPRLREFQLANPEIDIRISATDAMADPDDPDLDLALRYCLPEDAPPGSTLLFGELLTPVASPSLKPLARVQDIARHTLLEEDDERASTEVLSWRNWLRQRAPQGLEPRGWMYLNFTYQQVQAALAGQGIALARLAWVVEMLARNELVEPFGPEGRISSPFSYWLVPWRNRRERPDLQAFESWLHGQAALSRAALHAAGLPGGDRSPPAASPLR